MKRNHNIHFIGIGGVGMSGLAQLAKSRGYSVSGSDINSSMTTRKLEQNGIPVSVPHHADNIKPGQLVVYSTAIKPGNPEFDRATEEKIPLWHRSEFLASQLDGRKPICITGTHGKTTTTAMTSHILTESHWDPTCLIGGTYKLWGTNVRVGKSPWLVTEADESDGSFLNYRPYATLITNIDDDHLDHYGNLLSLTKCFGQFLGQGDKNGIRVVCGDDDLLYQLASTETLNCITYGFHKRNTFRVGKMVTRSQKVHFELFYREMYLGELVTPVVGEHNVLNSVGSSILCFALGVPFTILKRGLETFQGVSRRMDTLYRSSSLVVMDDYAHHPTAIRKTVASLKANHPGRVSVVFQPHRYTRTEKLYRALADALVDADQVYLCPIYSAGEKPVEGVTSELIRKAFPLKDRMKVKMVTDIEQTHHLIARELQEGELVASIGAGSVRKITEELAKHFSVTYPVAV